MQTVIELERERDILKNEKLYRTLLTEGYNDLKTVQRIRKIADGKFNKPILIASASLTAVYIIAVAILSTLLPWLGWTTAGIGVAIQLFSVYSNARAVDAAENDDIHKWETK